MYFLRVSRQKKQIFFPCGALLTCVVRAWQYILKVDVTYPKEMPWKHKQASIFRVKKENRKGGKTCVKSCTIQRMCHTTILNQVLTYGLKLKNVSRFIRFKQRYCMQTYIILNTRLITGEKMSLKKTFFKVMNNSLFGKTIKKIMKLKNITP